MQGNMNLNHANIFRKLYCVSLIIKKEMEIADKAIEAFETPFNNLSPEFLSCCPRCSQTTQSNSF